MDKYLVSLAIFLLLLECGWLLNDLDIIELPGHERHSSVGEGKVLAQLAQKTKEVKKRAGNSLVWEETRQEQNLYAYDSVMTMQQSAAEISVGGGSRISLNENTLVTIEPNDENGPQGPVRLHFKRGTLTASLDRGPQAIEIGQWVVQGGQKSQVTVRSDDDGRYEIETRSGETKIVNPENGVSKTVKAGQLAEISEKEAPVVKPVLDITWLEPADGARFYTHQNELALPLKWKGNATAAVIEKPDTRTSQSVPLTAGTDSKVEFQKGNYVVRLKNDTQMTFARNIAVWEAPKIFLIAPLPRHRVKLGTPVQLVWSMNPEVDSYKWQIATDDTFRNVISQGDTRENKATVKDLPLGEFYWRVQGKDELGYSIPELYSSSFVVVDNPLQAPKLKAPTVTPDDDTFQWWRWIIPAAEAAEAEAPAKHYKAVFQWEPVEGADSYNIEISDTPDFRDVVAKGNTREPKYKWRDFKLGKYYWRVAAQSDSGDAGLFSEIAVADLNKIPTKPIVPMTVAQAEAKAQHEAEVKAAALAAKKAAELAAATAAAAAAKPTATPAPTPAPTPKVVVEAPKPTPAPTPTPAPVVLQPKPVREHWQAEVRGGAHGIVGIFKGSDFRAFQTGVAAGDYRFLLTPPESSTPWRFEAEYQQDVLKIANSSAFPFQDPQSIQTFRVSAIKETSNQGEGSFGLTVHDQNLVFKRSDLESLSVTPALAAGAFYDWRWLHEGYETDYRFGVNLGQASGFEGRAALVDLFKVGNDLWFTVTVEGKATLGATLSGGYWGDATGSAFLGLRW